MRTILETLVDRFGEYGMRLDTDPAPRTELAPGARVRGTLDYAEGSVPLHIEVLSRLIPTAAAKHEPGPGSGRLLVGPQIDARNAERLRSLGEHYMDYAGNAFLSLPGHTLDVRGRRGGHSVLEIIDREKDSNLFSRKRSQVLFAFLAWPEIIDWPQRRIATIAGVAVGQVNGTLHLLIERGFLLDARPFRLLRGSELLDQWAENYPGGLGSPPEEQRFSGPIDTLKVPVGTEAEISGESAVADIAYPETLTLYVNPFSAQLVRENGWRRDARSTISIRPKFWTEPWPVRRSSGDGATRLGPAAPLPLIYADLLAAAEPRQREVAWGIRGQIIDRLNAG